MSVLKYRDPLTKKWVSILGGAGGSVTAERESVKDYGAKGDEKTDDTDAFQKALAAKRVVFVPGGTYVLSGTLVIRENCCLELSQDTVLKFTQTSGNCIEMRGSAVLRGNHAVISVAYGFEDHVIDMDTLKDGTDHSLSIPPYIKSGPQWKRQRFVYDVNIIKPTYVEGSSGYTGFTSSLDGECNGTAIYMSAYNVSKGATNPYTGEVNANNFDIPYMWGIVLSGIRIGGGFSYGIHAINYDSAVGSEGHYDDDGWNHDMRIEAVIEGCEIGVALENCNGAHLDVSIQPLVAARSGDTYAKHGVYLKDSRFVDMMRSRIWDWDSKRTKWAANNEFQHLALIDDCSGLLLDDFLVTEWDHLDIRSLIYTNNQDNFNSMTILQEPANKWFKSIENKPYFHDGTSNKKLMLASDKFTSEQMEFITRADGHYTYEPQFKNLAAEYGYEDNTVLVKDGTDTFAGCVTTGFIPIDNSVTNVHTYRIGGEGIQFTGYTSTGHAIPGRVEWFGADKKTLIAGGKPLSWEGWGNEYLPTWIDDDTVQAAFITDSPLMTAHKNAAYFRISAYGKGENLIVTVDEPVDYKATWHGKPKRLDDSIYAQKVALQSPNGKLFELTIAEDGSISAKEFAD